MRAEEVIVTHGNTDFDAFATMLAARHLYPSAVVCIAGSLNRNVREFFRLHADDLELVDAARLELDAIRRLIVVETTHAARLGELERVARDPGVETLVFDHHAGELPDWVSPENAVLSEDGALTTTLVSVIAERELPVTQVEATAFALGIHEDTGSLTYPTTTQRDADALAWCLRHGAYQELIASFLHTPLQADERELLNAMLGSLEPVQLDGVEALLASVEWPRYVEGVSNLAHKVVDLTDCRVLVALVAMDERVFCVARSRLPEVDAASIAAALGGRGHAEAASAIYRGSLDDARARTVEALPGAVREPVRARDLMLRPARVVAPDDSVSHAMVTCQRFGQSGILVADGDHLVGAVSREDLDKAIGHELSHAPVKGIMSTRVPVCEEDTTLAELTNLIEGSREGRIAVLREGRIVGVVTRGNVLRGLGAGAELEAPTWASLADRLGRLERLAPVFEAVAAIGEHYEGVYLVGGTVRDILLGEPSFDVDIAVEGDGISFARELARAFGGRVNVHSKFGTAVVVYGDDERVDVVTARTEFYESPAALPAVERASIREDLARRDFTINAMAVSLKGEDFGRLVDPFAGRRDLDERKLRVLHNLSFIEDPTRIFRGIRYENRHGLRMDEHTVQLARQCIEMELVGDLSSSRLRDELEALLEEGDVGHSILRLGELGADHAIHPRLAADEEAVRLLERLRALRDELGVDVPAWRLGLTVLARHLRTEEVYEWLDRLKVRRRDAEQIAAGVIVGPRLVERLGGGGATPAEVFELADRWAPDAPLFALAVADLPPLREYFGRLRAVRLAISGGDLAELGLGESPRVGEVLGELRRRKLNGELADGRESELAAARELIAEAS
jgi:tRNA nucleotidyltransferase (CCA-adding enzyme)